MFVHSPPDRPPHLIMLFCFLISRNAKCLCHLWTAKRANLGFSLIATVTSLLRLRWGGGGRHGRRRELEDGGMKTQLSSHAGRGVKERGRPTERRLEESNSREWGTACAEKKHPPPHPPQTPSWEGGGCSSGPVFALKKLWGEKWLHLVE